MLNRYNRVRAESCVAIASYIHRRATGATFDPKVEADALSSLMSITIPHGSLLWARAEAPGFVSDDPDAPQWLPNDGTRAAVLIKGLKSHQKPVIFYVDPPWLVQSEALTLYRGHTHVKDTAPRGSSHPMWYAYMFRDEVSLTWQRMIAGASSGEDVQLAKPLHRDLRMQSLFVASGPQRTSQGREEAIWEALRLHGDAEAQGQSYGLSRQAYEALLRAGFKLLDDTHGHKLKRQTNG